MSSQEKFGVAEDGMDLSGSENIEQIRSLLFGPQVKALETKITELDERTTGSLADLRGELSSRLDALEGFLKNGLDNMMSSLDAERKERDDNNMHLANELSDQAITQTQKAQELESTLERAGHDIREYILDQSKKLSEEINRKHQQASEELKRAVAALRDEHVDRTVLSSLLTETALKLNDGLMDSMLGKAEGSDEG